MFDDNLCGLSIYTIGGIDMFYLLLRVIDEERVSGQLTDTEYSDAISKLAKAHRIKNGGAQRWNMTKSIFSNSRMRKR